jgi:hypothetical protein
MRVTTLLVLLAAPLLVSNGHPAIAEETHGQEGIKVTLRFFSGMPDPEWSVLRTTAPAEFEELESYLERVQADAVAKPEQPSHLGYHGFSLERLDRDGFVRVAFGAACFVTTSKDGKTEEACYADKIGFEDFLAEMARREGYEDLVDSR